jgi:hypothetical protein
MSRKQKRLNNEYMHTKMLMTGAIEVDAALMTAVYISNRINVTVKI